MLEYASQVGQSIELHLLISSSQPVMSSSLTALSVELLSLITHFLDFTDLLTLRSTSSAINRKTWHQFIGRGFSCLSTDLSPQSVRKLEDISKIETLRYHVKSLIIDIETTFQNSKNGFDIFARDAWSRTDAGYLEVAPPQGRTFTSIFCNGLTSCTSFYINTNDDAGIGPTEKLSTACVTWSDVIGIFFSVIAIASLSIARVTIGRDTFGPNRIDAKKIPLPILETSQFRSRWRHLQELNLRIDIEDDDCDWCLSLVKSAPALKGLSLRFYNTGERFMTRLISEQQMQALSSISLKSAWATNNQVSKLLTSLGESLQHLEFIFVILKGAKWVAVFQEWKEKPLPCLRHLCLRWLREWPLGDDLNKIWFDSMSDNPVVPFSEQIVPRSDCRVLQPSGIIARLTWMKLSGKRRVTGVEYQGEEMESFLDILLNSVEHLPEYWYTTRP